MRAIERIYIHCSDSLWGEIEEIRQWHLQRGFSDIGYHYLICNQFPFYQSLKDDLPDLSYDGRVQNGRSLDVPGAHVHGDNRNTVGICLVGISEFTQAQLEALFKLMGTLLERFNLRVSDVLGHYEYWTERTQKPLKSCPNIDMETLRNDYLGWERKGRHLSFNVT